jgi:rod shape determining protein RodA
MDLVAGRYASEERRPIRHLDPMLLLVTGLIVVVGFFLLYSATATTLVGEGESTLARVEKQLVTAVIGIVLMLLVATFDYRFLKVYAGFLYAAMVVVLILVRIPHIGSTAIGDTTAAQRWFQVGSFQLTPSEFVKVGLIVMLAAVLSELRSPVPSLRDVIRVCAIAAVPLGLVFLQPDIGTSIVLIAVVAGMLVVAGTRPRHLLALSLAVVVMLFLAFQLHVIKDYQLQRLTSFLNSQQGTLSTNYNRQQAEIAVGSGGLFGRGYLSGTQTNLDFVPEQHTDFIFTVAGEEFGFVGSMLFLGLYGLLLWRAIRIAYISKDPFGTCLAAGVASMFAIQMFVNVGMVIGIMPITGYPLTLRQLRGLADARELPGGGDPAERAHAPLQVGHAVREGFNAGRRVRAWPWSTGTWILRGRSTPS